MMKFMENFRAELGRMRKHELQRLGPVPELRVYTDVCEAEARYMEQYKIGAEWRAEIYLPSGTSPALALRNVVNQFREACYGELRERLLRLEISVYEHDWHRAQQEIRDIVREIME